MSIGLMKVQPPLTSPAKILSFGCVLVLLTHGSATMALPNRPMGSHFRHTSYGGAPNSSGQSAVLLKRIEEKKAELEQLKQLKDLSATLAAQMEALQEKLSTLSDGTEGTRTSAKLKVAILSMF